MKEFEINGCISMNEDIDEDEFWNQFIDLMESKKWFFGGGMREIINTDDENNKCSLFYVYHDL